MSLSSYLMQAGLRRQSVLAAIGAAFYFPTGVVRYLRSDTPRKDPDGFVWKAGPTLVNIDGLRFGIGRRTQPVTLTLAGLSAKALNEQIARADVTGDGRTFFDLAKSQAREIVGSKIEFFLHQFADDWSYLERPTSLGVYKMDRLTPMLDASGTPMSAGVQLTCEPVGSQKFRASNAYLDSRDQQARYPGDRALDLMAKYVVKQSLPSF